MDWRTDRPTDGWMDRQMDPHIEMCGRNHKGNNQHNWQIKQGRIHDSISPELEAVSSSATPDCNSDHDSDSERIRQGQWHKLNHFFLVFALRDWWTNWHTDRQSDLYSRVYATKENLVFTCLAEFMRDSWSTCVSWVLTPVPIFPLTSTWRTLLIWDTHFFYTHKFYKHNRAEFEFSNTVLNTSQPLIF